MCKYVISSAFEFRWISVNGKRNIEVGDGKFFGKKVYLHVDDDQ